MATALCRCALALHLALSAAAVVLSRRGPPGAPSELAPRPMRRRPVDPAVMNFSAAGLCFAPPLEDTVQANWARVEGNVNRGRRLAAGLKAVFAGLLRSDAEAVRPAYASLMRIARQLKDYRFFVLENDSVDRTQKRLQEIAAEDERFKFISGTWHLPDTRGIEPSRMQRMANLRNKLRDWIETFMSQSPDWGLIVMIDFDIFRYGQHVLSPHAFFSTLGREETANNMWDMICANSLVHAKPVSQQNVVMYDCFAFRDESNDSFNAMDCGSTFGKKLWAGYDLVPVHSCFGGLAMYRPESFLRCRYDPSVYDCEHVVLHKCMREHGSQGRMFMDQLLTMSYNPFIGQTCSAGSGEGDLARRPVRGAGAAAGLTTKVNTEPLGARTGLPHRILRALRRVLTHGNR